MTFRLISLNVIPECFNRGSSHACLDSRWSLPPNVFVGGGNDKNDA